MSWNDGEVTIIPISLKKPSWGGEHWQPSWKGQYKGEEFSITKPPKNHYAYGKGYSVRFKWKGRHPRNDSTSIQPQIIGLTKLKTMPQVKKLIRTFVDGMLEGKFTDAKTGKRLTFTNFDTCTSCGVWEEDEESNINLHHRSMMFHHKLLDREEDTAPNYQCKRHTKYDALAEKIPQEQILISDLKRGGRRETRGKMKLLEMGIDMDTIIPDYELIQMFNPRQNIFEKRRRMKKNAETFEANDMIKERYFEKQLKKYENKLDWDELSRNPSLTPALIEKYENKLNWDYLCLNPALTPALIEKYENKLNWDWLSRNPSLTPAFIEKYEDKLYWDWLSQNPALTPALIEKYENNLEWYELSENPALTPALIEKYEDKLDWSSLSENPALTPALIEKYENKLDWDMLSANPSLTPALIEKYENKLDWDELSLNPSLNPALIEKYEDKFYWGRLSRNPSLTPAFIEKYEDKLDWSNLSRNPSLTPALIEKYEDKLNWSVLSLNPSLTPALIEKYEDKWRWSKLSRNPALFGNLHIQKKAEEGKKKRNPLLYGAIIVTICALFKKS